MTSHLSPPPAHRPPSVEWLVSPAPWVAAGAFSLWRAWMHWRSVNPFGTAICGDEGSVHCGWCYAAVGFAALALLAAARLVAMSMPARVRAAVPRT